MILKLGKLFPQSLVKDNKGKKNTAKIDRKILGKIVFADVEKLKILEDIIHPIIRKKYDEFKKMNELEHKKQRNQKF